MLIPNNCTCVWSAMQESFVEDDLNCFGSNDTQLSSYLEVGDNFAVGADESNDEDVNFLCLCAQRFLSQSLKSSKMLGGTCFC